MFDIYLALGDSMSIDFYPAQDAEGFGISAREDIGASALFHRNDGHLFPDFEGKDLVTKFPGIRYKNLAIDGATCEDLLSKVRASEISTSAGTNILMTLTLGGNDLLETYRRNVGESQSSLKTEVVKVQERYASVVEMLRKKLPGALLILTTIFDPTDGTGIMPAATPIYSGKLPIEFLDEFNRFIVSYADNDSTRIADVHKHFLGHGAECNSSESFWYWKPSPIEPSYRGASEIRRVWLDTLLELSAR